MENLLWIRMSAKLMEEIKQNVQIHHGCCTRGAGQLSRQVVRVLILREAQKRAPTQPATLSHVRRAVYEKKKKQSLQNCPRNQPGSSFLFAIPHIQRARVISRASGLRTYAVRQYQKLPFPSFQTGGLAA